MFVFPYIYIFFFSKVLVVENDQGEVVREFMKDTDTINLYKNMRETLGELQLHVIRMKDLFLKKLWSPDQGNKESHKNLKNNSFNLALLIAGVPGEKP